MNAGSRLLAPFARGESYRTLVYLATAVPFGATGLAVLVAGWSMAAAVAITPLIVVVLFAFRVVVGALAQAEAALARALLGVEVHPSALSPGSGFWQRALGILTGRAFWRQQGYLALRWVVGLPLAVAEWSLIVFSIGALWMPLYYRWAEIQFGGGLQVDTLPRALLFVPAGVVGLLIAAHALRPLGRLWRSLAVSLLSSDAVLMDEPPEVLRLRRRRAFGVHAAVFAGLGLLFVVIWALTTRAYFWPAWPLIALALPLAIHGWTVLLEERQIRRPQLATFALGIHGGVSAALFLFLVAVWALSSRGYFWPVWPLVGLAVLLGIHAIVVVARRSGSGELARRIETLERTRAGAVDVQEAELRRIERDLHDGAQARLVALGMSLGMAEQKLATDPEAAQALLAEAQQGTREALEELRTLARGIHPPVLADRGLEAAISTLADRTPLQVSVAFDLQRRPPRAVETAAYFVVAEALANAGKHAGATRVGIAVREDAGGLAVEIVDDGAGGANAAGNGLRGLARRVEALDGRLEVVSPAGGPTTIRAVMPCGS